MATRVLRRLVGLGVVSAVALGLLASPSVAPPAAAQVQAHDQLVSAQPTTTTPHVLDGEVFAVAEVGNRIVLGGSFTQARNASGTTATVTRNRILAFDKTTGQLDTAFAPSFNATVRTLVASPDGQSVYVGGQFGTMNGTSVPKILRLSMSNGQRIASFNPPAPDSLVYDAKLSGSRLFIAGAFGRVGNQTRSRIAELDPTTGALRAATSFTFEGIHNQPPGAPPASTFIYKIDVSPDGGTMVAIGNFRTVDQQDRVQIAAFDTRNGQTSLLDWKTDGYKPMCYAVFDYYIRDVDFSPDGSYFVTTSTGGYGSGPPSLCDTAVRWNTADRGQDVRPAWVDYTGGDSLYAVAVTGAAVYVGGHNRWTNNPFAGDAAGPGAVTREGIAALDPANGLPLTWNPGRTRGRGVFDLLATTTGLYAGSDTDRIANFQYRGRIAFFPLAGGVPVPQPGTPDLPTDVTVVGGRAGAVPAERYLYRVNVGGPSLPATDGGPAWTGDAGAAGYRNGGSNASLWSPVPTVDPAVPPGTPRAVFESERWDPSDAPDMQWSFPVPAGKKVELRVYLANRCSCTADPGNRVFDVQVDGSTAFDDVDLAADPGHDVGTVRTVEVTSDGSVDVSFGHVVENPLVNGFEIVDPAAPEPQPAASSAYLYRINAGGPALGSLDDGPDWSDDTAGGSPLRSSGSNAAGYGSVPNVQTSVPSTTPRALFSSERWDPNGGEEMAWTLPVTAGRQVELRLYLANRCGCTSQAGQRVFDITVDGATVVDDLDLSGQVGHDVGTVRTVPVTSDGSIDVRFVHGVENTLVNGIEVVDPALLGGPPAAVTAVERGFDGTSAGAATTVTGPSWNGVRGTVWVDGQLYTANVDGTFTRRAHNGTTFGSPTSLELYGLGAWVEDMQSMTSLFYDRGRLYFTLLGSDRLYWRYFSVQSGIVGAQRFDAQPGGVAWNQARGAFVASGQLFWANAATGSLHRTPWSSALGTTAGTSTVVSGPSVDGVDWRGRALFAVPGTAPNKAPVASATSACNGTRCVLDGSGSSDPDGSVTAWAWSLPGGASAQGATPTVDLQPGTSSVTLTVTDNRGGTGSTTFSVAAANAAPTARPAVSCSGTLCTFDGTASSDTDGTLARYEWSFGDGTSAVGAVVQHRYADTAARTAGLTVTDDRGTTGSATVSVTPSNAAPTAAFQVSCTTLSCTFDGSGSTDTDGTVQAWAWDFGDGTTGSGRTVTHPFAAAGTYPVTLRVTDDLGAGGQLSQDVTVTEQSVAHVGSAADTDAGSTRLHQVVVPGDVRAGDVMVLAFSSNIATGSISDPAGWQRRAATATAGMQAVLWTRTATAADAGAGVQTTTSAFARGSLVLSAYRGATVGAADAVLSRETASTAAHRTPELTAPTGGVLVSYWTDKTASTTGWTAPAGHTVRQTGAGSGAGHLSWLLTDSPAPAGSAGGAVATATSATSNAAMASIVLSPAP